MDFLVHHEGCHHTRIEIVTAAFPKAGSLNIMHLLIHRVGAHKLRVKLISSLGPILRACHILRVDFREIVARKGCNAASTIIAKSRRVMRGPKVTDFVKSSFAQRQFLSWRA